MTQQPYFTVCSYSYKMHVCVCPYDRRAKNRGPPTVSLIMGAPGPTHVEKEFD